MLRMVVRGLLLAAMGSVVLGSAAFAGTENLWQRDQAFPVTVSDSVSYPTRSNWMAGCTLSWSPVMQKDGTTIRERICAFHGSHLSMGRYTDAENHRYYVMKIGSDTAYREISNVNGYSERVFLRPSDNTLIVHFSGRQYSTRPRFSLFSVRNHGFIPEMSDTGFSVWRYKLDRTQADTLLGLEKPDGTIYNPAQMGYAFSPNREYVLSWMDDDTVVVTNTKTGSMKVIDVVRLGGIVDATVSNDGKYAALGSSGYIYHTEGCGRVYDYAFHEYPDSRFPNQCPMTRVYDKIDPVHRYGTWGAIFYFSDDNTKLSFDYPRENPTHHAEITTEAYRPEQLDYLALGDSYSSGEGDFSILGSHDLYMPYTDNVGPPKENCHLSKTSYPYLLRDFYSIDQASMRSVACSGAKVTDILAEKSTYLGQGDRLQDVSDINTYRGSALNRFIPGRIPQIEFVKTYQPKVITVGVGGNDAGFADELMKCVAKPFEVCDAASDLNSQRERVGQLVMDNFSKLRRVYAELKIASPGSTIYAIGYPQFINDSASPCLLNGVFVSESERHFINEAVAQMNAVIQSAASVSGATYIDIENSLDGGRLCEGFFHDYVTGVRNEFYLTPTNDELLQFLYHPNSEGHKKIAEMIKNQIGDNLLAVADGSTTSATPEYTAYFDQSKLYGSYVQSDGTIINAVPIQGESITASFEDGTYGNEIITLSMFSTPQQLGTFAPNQDGSLDATFTIPQDIEPGYHTLVFSGITYSGDPLEIVKTILVRSSDSNDVDGDGVLDSEDPCLFAAACNASVGTPSEPQSAEISVGTSAINIISNAFDIQNETSAIQGGSTAITATLNSGTTTTPLSSVLGAEEPSDLVSAADKPVETRSEYIWIVLVSAAIIELLIIKVKHHAKE